MSAQDKIERILKQIHVSLAEGETVSGDPDKVIVDKKEVLSILEKLNLAVYEIMDQYEVTSQARELAQRRSEKKGEEIIERVTSQAEDVYAASLIYTDDALHKVQHMMEEVLASSQEIFRKFGLELEQEKHRVKEDQMELREQLQDFKDSNKYLVMIEDCNREREKQEKEGKAPEKRIQNEAKHYAMNGKPEIKVNPAYFERRGMMEDGNAPGSGDAFAEDIPPMPRGLTGGDIPPMPKGLAGGDIPPMPQDLAAEEPKKPFVMPEIKVDLDAEYFKWQAEEAVGTEDKGEEEGGSSGNKASLRKEWRSLFGRK